MKNIFNTLIVSASLLASLAGPNAFAAGDLTIAPSKLPTPGINSANNAANLSVISVTNSVTNNASNIATNGPAGRFTLVGQPGPGQVFNKAKLVRCTTSLGASGAAFALRGGCTQGSEILFSPGETITAPAGLYLLGYENTQYPGWVEIKADQDAQVQLEVIQLPKTMVKKSSQVRVYRDMTKLSEQKKLYFTLYQYGQSLYSYGQYSFGDLYLRTRPVPEAVRSDLNNRFCESPKFAKDISGNSERISIKADRLCTEWNLGHFMAVSEYFDFDQDGTFQQYQVRPIGDGSMIGDAFSFKHSHLLVGSPITIGPKDGDGFVSVLPGSYTIEVRDATKADVSRGAQKTSAIAGQSNFNAITGSSAPAVENFGEMPAGPLTFKVSSTKVAGEDSDVHIANSCATSTIWRTDLRANCHRDSDEGCDRQKVSYCEPLPDIN